MKVALLCLASAIAASVAITPGVKTTAASKPAIRGPAPKIPETAPRPFGPEAPPAISMSKSQLPATGGPRLTWGGQDSNDWFNPTNAFGDMVPFYGASMSPPITQFGAAYSGWLPFTAFGLMPCAEGMLITAKYQRYIGGPQYTPASGTKYMRRFGKAQTNVPPLSNITWVSVFWDVPLVVGWGDWLNFDVSCIDMVRGVSRDTWFARNDGSADPALAGLSYWQITSSNWAATPFNNSWVQYTNLQKYPPPYYPTQIVWEIESPRFGVSRPGLMWSWSFYTTLYSGGVTVSMYINGFQVFPVGLSMTLNPGGVTAMQWWTMTVDPDYHITLQANDWFYFKLSSGSPMNLFLTSIGTEPTNPKVLFDAQIMCYCPSYTSDYTLYGVGQYDPNCNGYPDAPNPLPPTW